MLHRLALGLALAAPPGPGWAQDAGSAAPDAAVVADPLREPIDAKSRAALAERLQQMTIVVRRRGAVSPGVRDPGPGVEGRGFWAAPGRVVTAFALITGWPRHGDDQLEVVQADGTVRAAAVGLMDARLGLAVLDVPGLPAPSVASTPWAPPDAAVRNTAALFGAPNHGGPLWRARVGQRGVGQQAYYWWADGAAPLGTPLFDYRGRLCSLVGLPTPEVPGQSLLLPAIALRGLMDRSPDWWP